MKLFRKAARSISPDVYFGTVMASQTYTTVIWLKLITQVGNWFSVKECSRKNGKLVCYIMKREQS